MLTDKKLRELLSEIRHLIPDNEFCGVGLVICSNITEMPIVSLCAKSHLPKTGTLAEQIAECSISSNPCHD